jgi:FKBP-type peptidyl-prolyl cis-trans isomerase 2
VLLLLTLLFASCAAVTVAPGDTLSVTYTGRLYNGTIFDSNDPAHQADLPQKPASAFAPMTVTLGQGKLIPGFEQALIGMKEGASKTVTIKSADAYGSYKAELVRTIPKQILYNRTAIIRRDISVPIATLQSQLSQQLAVGQVFDTKSFRYNITGIGPVNATLRIIAANQTLTLEQEPWPSAVINMTPDTIVLRRDPLDKSVVSMPEGPYVVHLAPDVIRLETAFQLGQPVQSNLGMGLVTHETDSTLTIDLNHPLAGKDLTFDLRVDTIAKKK